MGKIIHDVYDTIVGLLGRSVHRQDILLVGASPELQWRVGEAYRRDNIVLSAPEEIVGQYDKIIYLSDNRFGGNYVARCRKLMNHVKPGGTIIALLPTSEATSAGFMDMVSTVGSLTNIVNCGSFNKVPESLVKVRKVLGKKLLFRKLQEVEWQLVD